MVKHWLSDHADLSEPPPFHIKVVSSFKDSMTRQISESVRIDLRGGGILNSKTEYSSCRLPRLVIDQEKWKTMKRQRSKNWRNWRRVLVGRMLNVMISPRRYSKLRMNWRNFHCCFR